VTCYISIWFTRPQTVTHPSTNRAWCRLTSLIKPTLLTTTLRRHPWPKHVQRQGCQHNILEGQPRHGYHNYIVYFLYTGRLYEWQDMRDYSHATKYILPVGKSLAERGEDILRHPTRVSDEMYIVREGIAPLGPISVVGYPKSAQISRQKHPVYY